MYFLLWYENSFHWQKINRIVTLFVLTLPSGLCQTGWAQNGPTSKSIAELRLTPVGEDCRYSTPIRVFAEVQAKNQIFIFDTGAPMHVFDTKMSAYLTPPIGSLQAGTPNGDVKMTIHKAPSISLTAQVIDLGAVAMTDLSKLKSAFGYSIAGILGAPMVIEFGLGFDQEADFFYLGRDKQREFATTFAMEINESNQLFSENVYLREKPLRCLIDTGMNMPLSITSRYFDELESRGQLRELYTYQAQTINGSISERKGLLYSLEVWGQSFKDVPVGASNENIIGLDLLKRFSFFLNGPDKIIEVGDGCNTTEPFLYDRSGLSIEFKNQKLSIAHIRPDSPAEKADLSVGTSILALNDQVLETDWKELFRLREIFSMPGPVNLKLRILDNTIQREAKLQW